MSPHSESNIARPATIDCIGPPSRGSPRALLSADSSSFEHFQKQEW